MQIVLVRAQLFLHTCTHIHIHDAILAAIWNPLKLNVTIHGSHFHSFHININSSRDESRIIPADDYTRRFSSRIHSALFPVSSRRVALQTRTDLKISNAVTLIVTRNLMKFINKKKTYLIESISLFQSLIVDSNVDDRTFSLSLSLPLAFSIDLSADPRN